MSQYIMVIFQVKFLFLKDFMLTSKYCDDNILKGRIRFNSLSLTMHKKLKGKKMNQRPETLKLLEENFLKKTVIVLQIIPRINETMRSHEIKKYLCRNVKQSLQ